MAYSLAATIALGLAFGALAKKLRLPALLGMLLLGVAMGPYGLKLISEDMLAVSGDLRKMALIVILLRAGLGIKKEILKDVGFSAIKLSFIPALLEGTAIIIIAVRVLGLSVVEAGMLGFILAAVSPAVVVPQMLQLIEQKKGGRIPTLVLAGTSVDDVVAITLFSTFLGMFQGNNSSLVTSVVMVPISVFLGVALGIGVGNILLAIYKRFALRDTKKVLLLIAVALGLTAVEDILKAHIPIASLLGVMAMGYVIQRDKQIAERLASKTEKIWVFAEVVLFVLVGAQVNVFLAVESGVTGLLIVGVGLLARSIGVLFSLWRGGFSPREVMFCIIAYTPKATVQAAIGAVPLTMGVPAGELILTFAVLAIVVTAPLGSIGIELSAPHLLGNQSSS